VSIDAPCGAKWWATERNLSFDEESARSCYPRFFFWMPHHQVTLKEDIWTGSCSLVGGRRATIKIGKETGRVLPTNYSGSSNQFLQQKPRVR